MFEEEKVDCFALLEDDLYYEKHYIHNVELLLTQYYDDTDIVSVSGFTRHTLYQPDDSLDKNKYKVVPQHNLIGAIYKRCGWPLLKEPFEDFLQLKNTGELPDDLIFTRLNEKYKLHMPHTAYDKIVDHIFAKHRKIRAATFNRYLFHMGLFGTSCVKSNEVCQHNQEALRNFIRFGWNLLTTDNTKIDHFEIDKSDPAFIEQFSKEQSSSPPILTPTKSETIVDKFDFRHWDKFQTYEDNARAIISSDPIKFRPEDTVLSFCGDVTDKLRILDFGCGMGRNTFELSLNRPWEVVGYDNSSMIKHVGEFCQTWYKKPMSDFPDVSFTDNWDELRTQKFDCILCCLVFQHVPEVDICRYLEDFKNMTKKIVIYGRRAHDSIDGNTWRIMEKYGFFPTQTWSYTDVKYVPDGHPEDHSLNVYCL
jgi:2-polyprenyl-3-methyl-5-hydroxy-6-metoxy-1,4-benzoquinol methylase